MIWWVILVGSCGGEVLLGVLVDVCGEVVLVYKNSFQIAFKK